MGDGDTRDGTCGEEEEEEEEEDLDELRDLSDEGTGGDADSEAGEREDRGHGQDGQAEPGAEEGTDLAPTHLLAQEDRKSGWEESAGAAQQAGVSAEASAVPFAGGDAAAAAAPAGVKAEMEPSELGSLSELPEPTAGAPSETNKDHGGRPLPCNREQICHVGDKEVTAAAVAVPVGAEDAAQTATDGGGPGAAASGDLTLNGVSGAPSAEEDGPGNGNVTENGGKDNDSVSAVPDGNPDETAEAAPAKCGEDTTGSPSPPSRPLGGRDGARTTSKGAAAAMQCQWLPVKLPPPPPSAKGEGGVAQETIAPPSPELQAKGVGLDPPPAVDALCSPQDAALLKRKADRDFAGK